MGMGIRLSSGSVPMTSSTGSTQSYAANGKIDHSFKQGNIGDCALLSTIFGLSNTTDGRSAISDAIKINKDKQGKISSYDVSFKGIGETYHITQSQVEEAKRGYTTSTKDSTGKTVTSFRKYSSGDDDMTVLELAFENCFEKTKNKTMRGLVDNYTSINANDKLNGVNPASVTYALTGNTTNWLTIHPKDTLTGHFTLAKDVEVKDSQGKTVTLKKDNLYKPLSMANDKSFIRVFDFENGAAQNINYSDLVNKVLNPDRESDKAEAKKLLENFKNTNSDSVLVFATGSSATSSSGGVAVKDSNGNNINLTSPHAYNVTNVKDGIVTLVDPHSSGTPVQVKMDSLLGLKDFFVYNLEF